MASSKELFAKDTVDFSACPRPPRDDPSNCLDGGCSNGFCFCSENGRLEFKLRRCHPAYNSSVLPPGECPLLCNCGCRSSEVCGSDGRCYCPDNGTLVVPIIHANHTLLSYNQTCPQKELPESPPENNSGVLAMLFSSTSIIILVLVLGLSFLGFFILAIVHNRTKARRKASNRDIHEENSNDPPLLPSRTRESSSQGNQDSGGIALEAMRDNDLYQSAQLLFVDTLNLLGYTSIIERDRIVLEKQIGEGNFGKVFKGRYTGPSGTRDVAIKVPRVGAVNKVQKDVYAEAKISMDLDHENILKCLGVCIDTSAPDTGSLTGSGPQQSPAASSTTVSFTSLPNTSAGGVVTVGAVSGVPETCSSPWIIFEYMPFGDLLEVLRCNNNTFSSSQKEEELPILKMADLWWLSIQIARGMKYLSEQRYTHRDLAARNCLVGRNLILKISDFGLTRDIYTNEYYQMGKETRLPIRWMAPESIRFGKFSTESDIWSFGITLWEIITFGARPFFSYSNQEVANLVQKGQLILSPPSGCPELLAKIMVSCFELQPEKRITFQEIVQQMETVSAQLQEGGLSSNCCGDMSNTNENSSSPEHSSHSNPVYSAFVGKYRPSDDSQGSPPLPDPDSAAARPAPQSPSDLSPTDDCQREYLIVQM